MNNSTVILFFIFSFVVSSVSILHSRSKRLLLLPEFSANYKYPSFKTIQPRASNLYIKKASYPPQPDDQRKREIRMPKTTMMTTSSNINEDNDDINDDVIMLQKQQQTKSICHPCYFSPIQCLLTIPEDQMRTFVKTHNNVQNIDTRFMSSLPQRNRVMSRVKQHDDRHNLFGAGLFRLSPFEKY
jgi:hypothetical protein